MNRNINVLALNDICSYGKVSLTVNIPILSSFSIKVSPLPTVLLSNHTQFESFCAFDLTDQLVAIVEELKNRTKKFDAFYVGWISGERQVELAFKIKNDFEIPLTVIDPILGDNGKLYAPITDKHVLDMKRLITCADIITPNITEAAALLGYNMTEKVDLETLKKWALELTKLGPKSVVITSVEKGDKIGSLCYSNNKISEYYYDKVPLHIPGTGDAFGSALLGYILTGLSLEDATNRATKFVYEAVLKAKEEGDDATYGIAIEKRLSLL